jgi:hypothetical protein
MTALADEPRAAEQCCQQFGLPAGMALMNVLRVGPAPHSAQRQTPRLPVQELVV